MQKGDWANLLSRRVSIGVTGFSRAGKTVFVGSLAQALLRAGAWAGRRGQGPLAGFGPFERGTFRMACIRDDAKAVQPHFPFRKVRDALCGIDPRWPTPTEGLSLLVLDLAIEQGKKSKWPIPRRHVQIELVDYPGEWLVDLPMLNQEYTIWSNALIERARHGQREQFSQKFFEILESLSPPKTFDEELAAKLTDAWTEHLSKSADVGLVFNQPGRLLRPDSYAHSPVLRLVPLPESWSESGFYEGMKRRFREYRKKVIKPFYKKHFSRIDRQIVLVDLLQALDRGEEAFNEMADALGATLKSFAYGDGGILDYLLGNRTSHLLFAATKADHVTRGDRNNLKALLNDLLLIVDDTNIIASGPGRVEFMALASVRATEDRMTDSPPKREILNGRQQGQDQAGQLDPGGLPLDLPPNWKDLHFEFKKFEPVENKRALKEGFPAVNLGKTLDFLIGDLFE